MVNILFFEITPNLSLISERTWVRVLVFVLCHIKIHWFFLYFEWIFYPCTIWKHHILIIWKWIIHCVMQIFELVKIFILQYLKCTFINISTNLTRKVLVLGKVLGSCQAHSGKYILSKILFSLESLKAFITSSKVGIPEMIGSLG